MREQILGLTTPVMAAAFAAVFFALWWRGKMGTHVLAFAVSYACFTLGFMVTHLLPTGSIYTFHLTYLFYSLCSMTSVMGACLRVGRPAFLGTQMIIFATAAMLLTVATLSSDDAAPRLMIVNTTYGAMMLVGVLSMLGAPRRHVLDTLIVVVFAVSTFDFFVRPTLQLLVEKSIPVATYRSSLYYSVINLVLMVKALTAAIVLASACVYELVVKMRDRSERDPLTGLRNRRAFEEAVESKIVLAAQQGVPISVVVADIDHFKQVNDIWGHQAGDDAIANFGRLLAETVRHHDVCGRIGGEEFCIIVWDCPEREAVRLAERLRARFAEVEHSGLGEDIRLSASFGVSEWLPGESYHRLFSRADAALYRAKDNGRNRVEQAIAAETPHGRRASDARRRRKESVAA